MVGCFTIAIRVASIAMTIVECLQKHFLPLIMAVN